MKITADKLYNYIQCPHRVWRDIFGPKEERLKGVNLFVQLLWNGGVQFEKEVIKGIGDFLDLSDGDISIRFKRTIAAMKAKESIIYQGVLIVDELLGIPDLLIRQDDGQYCPADIKSGSGLWGGGEEFSGKYKKSYAVQLCLYADALNRLGFLDKHQGKIKDIYFDEIKYNLDSLMGVNTPITWWDFYRICSGELKVLFSGKKENTPARCGACKLCQWYESCKKWCEDNDDLTNIFYLGRSKRDVLIKDLGIATVNDFYRVDIKEMLERKTKDKNFLKGVGATTLKKMVNRAKIIKVDKKPVIYEQIHFPKVKYELFLDIESDPTRDFVYLHGIWERSCNGEKFVYFLADDVSSESERKAWIAFWAYIDSLPRNDYSVYYYSPYEKTIYKRMAKLYPDVRKIEDVDYFFDNHNVIDLYSDVIYKKTDWPLSSYSIKEIAQYLGFKWRDESPSGALSIQWFNEYINAKDSKILQRILEYNEDDCKATLIVKDGIETIQNHK